MLHHPAPPLGPKMLDVREATPRPLVPLRPHWVKNPRPARSPVPAAGRASAAGGGVLTSIWTSVRSQAHAMASPLSARARAPGAARAAAEARVPLAVRHDRTLPVSTFRHHARCVQQIVIGMPSRDRIESGGRRRYAMAARYRSEQRGPQLLDLGVDVPPVPTPYRGQLRPRQSPGAVGAWRPTKQLEPSEQRHRSDDRDGGLAHGRQGRALRRTGAGRPGFGGRHPARVDKISSGWAG